MHVIGIDVGTQGVRTVVCDADGNTVAQTSHGFAVPDQVELLPPGWSEQNPTDWWEACRESLQDITGQLHEKGFSAKDICAVAVDSTSGTLVAVDSACRPLRAAIMYNDTRAASEALECNSAGADLTERMGYSFSSGFTLPKIVWVRRNEPEIFEKAVFIHAADYIVGMMTGSAGISDTSNALKTGYDLLEGRWPPFLESALGIPSGKLPEVVKPGTVIGEVSTECSRSTGLFEGTPVVAGVTDGTAGFFASGAVKVGDWSSTLGTTLVIRGVSSNLIKDAQGRIYCHAHPEGSWLPGGASNSGAECLEKLFHGRNLSELNAYVPQYSPTALLVYPLVRRGERLPFVNPEAEGFIIGEPRDSRELYAGYLEGVAYVERWCYELLADLGAEVGDTVYATGGGARSPEWLQVRADLLQKRMVRPVSTECAIGAAVVAASRTLYDGLESAVVGMARPGMEVEPDPRRRDIYEQCYRAFRGACSHKGYE